MKAKLKGVKKKTEFQSLNASLDLRFGDSTLEINFQSWFSLHLQYLIQESQKKSTFSTSWYHQQYPWWQNHKRLMKWLSWKQKLALGCCVKRK